MKGIFLIVFVVLIVFSLFGCSKTSIEKEQAYEKCTSVCSSVLNEDFVSLHLCNEQCKVEFLNAS